MYMLKKTKITDFGSMTKNGKKSMFSLKLFLIIVSLKWYLSTICPSYNDVNIEKCERNAEVKV